MCTPRGFMGWSLTPGTGRRERVHVPKGNIATLKIIPFVARSATKVGGGGNRGAPQGALLLPLLFPDVPGRGGPDLAASPGLGVSPSFPLPGTSGRYPGRPGAGAPGCSLTPTPQSQVPTCTMIVRARGWTRTAGCVPAAPLPLRRTTSDNV